MSLVCTINRVLYIFFLSPHLKANFISFRNKDTRLICHHSSRKADGVDAGPRNLSSSCDRRKRKLISNPDLLSYLLMLLVFFPRATVGSRDKASIVIDRKNTEVPPNSLISFPSLSRPLFRVAVPSRKRRFTTMPLCLALLPQFPGAWPVSAVSLTRYN